MTADRAADEMGRRHARMLRRPLARGSLIALMCLCWSGGLPGAAADDEHLPGTQPLTLQEPLDEAMVAGIDRFALRELKEARRLRTAGWGITYRESTGNPDLAPPREKLKAIIGVVDSRVPATGIEVIRTIGHDGPLADHADYTVEAVRWNVLEGVTAEGLLLDPKQPPVARLVFLPDADMLPEQLAGIAKGSGDRLPEVRALASRGVQVLIPVLINRDSTWSKHPLTYATNLPHREYVYRMAFELGRHVIGYEVQKVLAAVDQFEALDSAEGKRLPVGVAGIGEGGLVALFAAAIEPRIDTVQVIDAFEPREQVWEQPIYRNVWSQLIDFGDAELAVMAAFPTSRRVVISRMGVGDEVEGPPEAVPPQRASAAPGAITLPTEEETADEFARALRLFEDLEGGQPKAGERRGLERRDGAGAILATWPAHESGEHASEPAAVRRALPNADDRQRRQVLELVGHVQTLLRRCAKVRDALWSKADRSSVEAWRESTAGLRDMVYNELIGRLPESTMPLNPRSRRVLDEPDYTGYEVVLDVYPEVIAGGILLLPKDLKEGERRPVVVCQHGLEGIPMHTIFTDPEQQGHRAYKGFSVQLVKRGFIVYAPQNPYRGRDRFRTLQRKSNPMKRSLFSYIIPQHERTLEWLSSLPNVDPQRIAFYGLSYGGKTAVRVPPFVPQYALSICSADFNEWVVKNASSEDRYSYVYTGEYEIFEWNMGHIANYAELASLMAPRPFMVERGHDDGVAPDEWVAWEFAKVRRHYVKLGLGDRTEIEFFDGPHTINGQGTFDFLHRHLDWPVREAVGSE